MHLLMILRCTINGKCKFSKKILKNNDLTLLVMYINTTIVVIAIFFVSVIVIGFAYILMQINDSLNVLLTIEGISIAGDQHQSRENIKNTYQDNDNYSENKNQTSTNQSSSTSLQSQQDGINIFPFSFIQRALIPDPSLIISVVFRTIIISIIVFLIIKWLGSKGLTQLSPFAFILFIGLGSAVGDPMIYKDMSIPQAMIAVLVVVIFFKAIDYSSSKSKKVQNFMKPKPVLLIKDGKIDENGLKKANVDKDELESQIRIKGLTEISEILSAYLEPSGQISFIIKKSK